MNLARLSRLEPQYCTAYANCIWAVYNELQYLRATAKTHPTRLSYCADLTASLVFVVQLLDSFYPTCLEE